MYQLFIILYFFAIVDFGQHNGPLRIYYFELYKRFTNIINTCYGFKDQKYICMYKNNI